jgi:hypothetical protein
MSEPAVKERVPDGGCLPHWELAELPEPKPFSIRNALRAIGPGVILLGAAIGSGEWLIGPALTARYGGMLLWVATISILLQVCLNTEAARYALATGEPIFSGFMRCRPGSRFWSFFYIAADSTGLWPGLVANGATAVAAAWLTIGASSGEFGPAVVARLKDETHLIRTFAYLIFALCVSLVLFGGKVYTMLKRAISFMVAWVLGYLILVDLFMVGPSTWGQVALGFLSFGSIPAGVDWSLVAAFAAFAGAGGLGNASTGNYIREQGWGMGGQVGAIPSAVGGKEISLSHIGKVFALTPENIRRFREWYKYVRFDQYGIWAGGCFFGVALPAMLAVRFIPRNTELSGWDGAAFQAAGIAREYGAIFWYLTLLCGFCVMFSSQLLVVDSVGRRWSDMIWTGTLAGKEQRPTLWSVLLLGLGSLLFALLISAGVLRGAAILFGALALYGVPLGIRAVAVVARSIRESEIEARMLVPVTLLFLASMAVGLAFTIAGRLAWGNMAMMLVVGVLWLLGSLFIIARGMQPHSVYKIYYLVVGIYVTWCCIALQIAQPLQMIIISANIGGFLLVITALHTWYVNRRFLPKALQPGMLKQGALLLCAAWYLCTTLLSFDRTLQKNGVANLGLVDAVSRFFGQ